MPFRGVKRYFRRLRMRRHGIEEQVHIERLPLAYKHGAWMVHPRRIDRDSVVYSFGVGSNVAWDLAMIEHFGCTIHAFDPTPKSIQWVSEQDLPPQFVFHPYGIGARDGSMTFFPPRRESSFNYSSIDRGSNFEGARRVKAPVYRLRTIMEMLGHDRLDVLKMDIEGGEYAVIDDLLESDIGIGQILVEFHHNFRSVSFSRTVNAIRDLNRHGYRIFHLSQRGYELSLINGAIGRGDEDGEAAAGSSRGDGSEREDDGAAARLRRRAASSGVGSAS